jgi:hypothetical protein
MLNTIAPAAYRPRVSFDSNNSGSLVRTFSSGVSRRVHAVSFFIRSNQFASSYTVNVLYADTLSTTYAALVMTGDASIRIDVLDVVSGGSPTGAYFSFGDFFFPPTWQHVLVVVDTTEATASNRVKCWVNGTSLSPTAQAGGYFTLNQELSFGNNKSHYINSAGGAGVKDINIADFNHIIGTSGLSLTEFGVVSGGGAFTAKKYRGANGTGGYRLLFNNASNLGEDAGGNDFALLGSPTQSTDTPPAVL